MGLMNRERQTNALRAIFKWRNTLLLVVCMWCQQNVCYVKEEQLVRNNRMLWRSATCMWCHQNPSHVYQEQLVPNNTMLWRMVNCGYLSNFKSFGLSYWLEKFRHLNFWVALSLILWGVLTCNFGRTLKIRSSTYCKEIVTIIVISNFWWRHHKPRIHCLSKPALYKCHAVLAICYWSLFISCCEGG